MMGDKTWLTAGVPVHPKGAVEIRALLASQILPQHTLKTISLWTWLWAFQ